MRSPKELAFKVRCGCISDRIFCGIETALASASIAQVHQAVLRPEWAATVSGGKRAGCKWTKVAVKVRHKTIANTLTGDLTTLRAMLGWQVRLQAYFCGLCNFCLCNQCSFYLDSQPEMIDLSKQ